MVAGPVTTESKNELSLHTEAYLQLFQAVLKNRNLQPAQKDSLLSTVRDYIHQNIKTPDDFIGHISNFAKTLNVSEGALANFIGSNFLKALSMVKQQAAEKPAHGGAVSQGAPARPGESRESNEHKESKSGSLIAEILSRFGTIIEAPDRFVEVDNGNLKLVTRNGEVFGTGMNGGGSSAMPLLDGLPSSPPAASSSVTSSASPSMAAGKPSGPPLAGNSPAVQRSVSSPSANIGVAENSIIKEILEKFGSMLDIPGKLVVSDDDYEPDAVEAPVIIEETPAGPKTVTVTRPSADKPAAVYTRESSLIKEILEKFGNILDIPGKLIPSSGIDEALSGESYTDADMPDEEESTEEEQIVSPIPFDFEHYIETVKKIQEFQASGDQDSYRAWLNSSGTGRKAMIGLRNLDRKEKNGQSINRDAEQSNIAAHLNVSRGQVTELSRRLKKFEQLQRILQQLTTEIKSRKPEFMNAVKKIWPQLRLLFQIQSDVASMNSQLKIVLLQIPDPALKSEILTMMEPVFQRVYQVHQHA